MTEITTTRRGGCRRRSREQFANIQTQSRFRRVDPLHTLRYVRNYLRRSHYRSFNINQRCVLQKALISQRQWLTVLGFDSPTKKACPVVAYPGPWISL